VWLSSRDCRAARNAGGLATSWRRGDYTFATCLHRFTGCKSDGALHRQQREVFHVNKLKFVYPDEFVRVETEQGESLSVYSDVDRLEAEFIRQAPQDAFEIQRFTAAIRYLADCPLLDPSEGWPHKGLS